MVNRYHRPFLELQLQNPHARHLNHFASHERIDLLFGDIVPVVLLHSAEYLTRARVPVSVSSVPVRGPGSATSVHRSRFVPPGCTGQLSYYLHRTTNVLTTKGPFKIACCSPL